MTVNQVLAMGFLMMIDNFFKAVEVGDEKCTND